MNEVLRKYRDELSRKELEFGWVNNEFSKDQIDAWKEHLQFHFKAGFDIAVNIHEKFIDWYKHYSTTSAFAMNKAFTYYIENIYNQ